MLFSNDSAVLGLIVGMEYRDPHFRTRRPLRIAVLGAKNVGKTTLALQFVTNETQIGT